MSEVVSVGAVEEGEQVAATLARAIRAVERLVTGGVAWPDVDVADALAEAGDGLRGVGLQGGFQRMQALSAAIENVAVAADRAVRDAEVDRAIVLVQTVLAWLRVTRAMLDLERVRMNLEERSAEPSSQVPRATWSGIVRPVGVEFRGPHVVVHAVSAEGPVLLIDDWVDAQQGLRMDRHVISRLFGSRIIPRRLLQGHVHLSEHPVAREGPHRVFRPSFIARPRLRDSGLAPAKVPEGDDPCGRGQAVLCTVRIEAREGRPVLIGPEGPLQLPESPEREVALETLRTHPESEGLSAVICRRGTSVSLLALDHPLRGRTVPDLEPGAFPLDAQRLLDGAPQNVQQGAWLAAALVACGAEGRTAVAEETLASGVLEQWRVAYARTALGRAVSGDAESVRRAVACAGDEELWPLLDLARLRGVEPAIRVEREAAWTAWGQTSLRAPSVSRICARTLQIAAFGGRPNGPTAEERARAFLDAHVERLRVPSDPDLWPSPLEWLWLARAAGCTVMALDVPRLPLLRSIIAAVHLWARRHDARDLNRAGDALWCAIDAGLADQVVR